ncbi:MAG TPA: NADH-quinone oxidoreductase subunit J [Phycisphaerales bacterium]|nr:NADH-quinone oxidoreductase subunit J [Phycisphaerales bacterium]
MSPLLFYLIAGIIIIPALAVVVSENLFHAGLSMIVSFLGIAAIYATLSAPFVAAMQVLVYAGAIAVILLFAFMLTHDIMRPQQQSSRIQQTGAAVACSLLTLFMVRILIGSQWTKLQVQDPKGIALDVLGTSFLTDYLVPFELISVLLLMTLVGAIVIARKEEKARLPETAEDKVNA